MGARASGGPANGSLANGSPTATAPAAPEARASAIAASSAVTDILAQSACVPCSPNALPMPSASAPTLEVRVSGRFASASSITSSSAGGSWNSAFALVVMGGGFFVRMASRIAGPFEPLKGTPPARHS